jgi:hypothetical protein
MLFPGNRLLFIELLNNIRWEDWEYEYGYAGNRFGYLGNGFTQREKDGRGESNREHGFNALVNISTRYHLLLRIVGWKR